MSSRSRTLIHRYAFPSGFTIIELLVVVSIIALLIGILLPAISKARDSAKVTQSLANLRNLAAAHQSYAAEWSDRQFTLVRDDLGLYDSMDDYEAANGEHPNIILGYGFFPQYTYVYYDLSGQGAGLAWPVNGTAGYGWFRLINCRNFNTYVNGRFYDKTFYAPKDRIVLEAIGEHMDGPGEFGGYPDGPYWSSYVLSPAALFAPNVMNMKDCNLHAQGFDSMGGGAFRVPSMSQARNPSLKTHMIEHNWLQNNRGLYCNPAFDEDSATFDGCEPYYFNHSIDSAPACMFFDGSVRIMGVRESTSGDAAVRGAPDAPTWAGLYFRPGDEGFTEAGNFTTQGYFLPAAYDQESFDAEIGFHILTKDGILGRDTLGGT